MGRSTTIRRHKDANAIISVLRIIEWGRLFNHSRLSRGKITRLPENVVHQVDQDIKKGR